MGFGTGIVGPGGQIGPYKLLSILGEGGCGVVYLAEQVEPVRRRVAFKAIKPGMDSRQVIARFEAERQALALLDHPNIARVYDAGATPLGRPYFVMEYVKGVSITEHCDRHRLSIDERLRLFQSVCRAVQHAHQKGIIHRDLKPTNILVCLEGDTAVPKIIDFGVAKALSQLLTERTLATEHGQMIGTPEYMSPEQADLTAQDIDTRSDIYSLGVVLYELLTGVLPFDPDTLRKGGFESIRRTIAEVEPRTPATRLRSLGPGVQRIAESRRTDAGTLARHLRRELEWIPLKAMRKDRNQRYSSAVDLARDIDNYHQGLPLAAGPESTGYRIRKFARRHRTLVIAGTAVLLILIASTIVADLFALGQRRARAQAEAVSHFLTRDLLGLVDPAEARSPDVSVRYILDGAARKLDGKFPDQPLVEASIRTTLGQAYAKLGEYRSAEPHLTRALALYERSLGSDDARTLAALDGLAAVYFTLFDLHKVEPLAIRSLEIKRRTLGEQHASTLLAMEGLGSLYLNRGDLAAAKPLLTSALEVRRRRFGEQDPNTAKSFGALACLYFIEEQPQKAEPLLDESFEVLQRHGDRPDVQTFLARTAVFLASRGQYGRAESWATQALEDCRRRKGDEDMLTLNAMATLGTVYNMAGRPMEAAALLESAFKTGRRVFGDAHPVTRHCMNQLIAICMQQEDYARAEELLLRVQETARPALGENHPTVRHAVRSLVAVYEKWDKTEQAAIWRARMPKE